MHFVWGIENILILFFFDQQALVLDTVNNFKTK